jgi:hypothetical protein
VDGDGASSTQELVRAGGPKLRQSRPCAAAKGVLLLPTFEVG